jgi:hypothetical protein
MQAANTAMEDAAASGMARTQVSGPNGYTLEFWDQVKRYLDDRVRNLSKDRFTAEAARVDGIRKKLVAELDNVVPAYEEARGVAAGIFDATDALNAGEKFVASKLSNEAARFALHQMSPQEQNLFRQGYVGRLIEHVRELGDRRTLVSVIGQSPGARERLEIALGPDGAHQLEAFLQNERMMDFVRGAVTGNSTTARQIRDMMLASSVGGAITSFDPHNPSQWIVGILTGALTKYGKTRINTFLDARLANEIADRLVSRDPTVMRRGLEQLSQPRALEALRAFDEWRTNLAPAAGQMAPSQQGDTRKLPRVQRGRNAMAPDDVPMGSTASNPETGERLRYVAPGQWAPT